MISVVLKIYKKLRKIKKMLATLLTLLRKMEKSQMSRFNEVQDAIDALNVATTKVGERITKLTDQVKTGMTPEEVETVQAELNRLGTNLNALAADPENPVPELPAEDGADDVA